MPFRLFRKLFVASSLVLAAPYLGCGSDDASSNPSGTGGTGVGGASGAGSGGTTSGGGTGGGTGGVINIGGSGNAGAGGTQGDACAKTVVDSTLVPANLLFLIDRSGSMNCNLPSDGQSTAECESFPAPKDTNKPTKWELTRDALKTAVKDLQTSGNVSAGMVVFPRPATDCGVTDTPDVAVQDLGTNQVTALQTFLDGVAPKGKTPLAGATILSYKHLYDLLKGGSVSGNLFVVLLTDGFETCTPLEIPKLLNVDMPNARLINVRTFVIGVPGSEDGRSLLSEMSYQGGTAKTTTCSHSQTQPPTNVGDCHFDMTTSPNFAQDLKAALAQISGAVLSCEIDVPAAPPGKKINYNSVSVQVNGGDVSQDNSTTCDQANGWQFSQDKSKIFLCGTPCDDAKKPGATISLDLGCLSDVR